MLGWVTAALLSFFFLASPVFAQCTYQREYGAPFRTSWLDLDVDDSYLWAATGYGVALLDRTVDPPKIVATKALPGTTRFIEAGNGVAYAAAGSTVWTVRLTAAGLTAEGTDFGRPINDLDLAGTTLVTATTDGIFVSNVANLSASAATRFATGVNIFSVAIAGTVVAANGDRSLETFSFGGVPGPALMTTVNATALHVVGDVLYASDGQTTDVFTAASSTRLGTIPFGSASLVASSPNVLFSAGNDRRLRALDVSVLTAPVELFEAEIIPSGGSVNRVAALEAGGGRLYVAGGDTGLTTYDIASFIGPYALRGYPFGFATSLASTDDTIIVSLGAGGLAEVRRAPSGSLTLNRTWATQQQHAVQDIGSNGLLLTSSAAVLNYWTLAPTTPSLFSTATFSGPVVSAVVRGATAYAVLEDGTLWSADLSQTAPAPVRVTAIPGTLAHIARAGENVFTAELTAQGSTVVRLHPNGDLASSTPLSVPGAATALAVHGNRAAVFTFSGITILDFGSSEVRVLPQSNAQIVTDLDLAGNTLVALTSTSAIVWDLVANRSRTFALPSDPLAVDLAEGGAVAIASTEGVIALNPSATSQQPVATSLLAGNKYYRKAVGGKDRLYLFDGRSVDIFDTHFAGAPRYVATAQAPGALDLAASPDGFFVLFSNSTLTQYSRGGEPVRTLQVSTAADTTPLSVATVDGLPWVSVTQGCQTTGCENRTFVFSPQFFSVTATLPGALVDVTTADKRAFALFDSPRETRAYDLSDAFHPRLLVSRPSDPGALAIALIGTSVLVLGDRLTTNNESTLVKTGDLLPPQALAANADLVVDGSCSLVAGRRPEVEINSGFPAMTPAGLIALPGAFRSIAGSDGRYYVLSDYGLEVLSRVTAPRPPRRRAAQ